MKEEGGVTFTSGRLVHAPGGFFYPTLCRRVMRWHKPIPTDAPVTCPDCLDLSRKDRVR